MIRVRLVLLLIFRYFLLFFLFLYFDSEEIFETLFHLPLQFLTLKLFESLIDPFKNFVTFIIVIKVLHECLVVLLLVFIQLNFDFEHILFGVLVSHICELDHLV